MHSWGNRCCAASRVSEIFEHREAKDAELSSLNASVESVASSMMCFAKSLAPAGKRDVYYPISAGQQIFERVKRCEDVIKEHRRRCLGQIELAAIESERTQEATHIVSALRHSCCKKFENATSLHAREEERIRRRSISRTS